MRLCPACSLGVLHWPAPSLPLLDELLGRVLTQQAQLTPWIICNIMWGCARLL